MQRYTKNQKQGKKNIHTYIFNISRAMTGVLPPREGGADAMHTAMAVATCLWAQHNHAAGQRDKSICFCWQLLKYTTSGGQKQPFFLSGAGPPSVGSFYGRSPLVLRSFSAFKAYNDRTTSGQRADNDPTEVGSGAAPWGRCSVFLG